MHWCNLPISAETRPQEPTYGPTVVALDNAFPILGHPCDIQFLWSRDFPCRWRWANSYPSTIVISPTTDPYSRISIDWSNWLSHSIIDSELIDSLDNRFRENSIHLFQRPIFTNHINLFQWPIFTTLFYLLWISPHSCFLLPPSWLSLKAVTFIAWKNQFGSSKDRVQDPKSIIAMWLGKKNYIII